MNDWGWKVMKQGASTSSTDLRDLLANSSFNMFKYHLDTTSSMTINAGDTTKTITIPHGLSYVPAFLTYQGDSDYVKLLPNRKTPAFTGIDEHWYSYADSTNIYIVWKSIKPYNQFDIYASDYWNTYDNNEDHFSVGRISNNPFEGALRFQNINVSSLETLISAKVNILTDVRNGTGSIKFKTYGIDEDNTNSFNNPMGRSKTDAFSTNDRTVPTNLGDSVEVDVINQMNEIKSRGGWSSGNAMGFIINENSGSPDAWFRSDPYGYGSYLRFIKSGSINYSFRVIVFKDKIA